MLVPKDSGRLWRRGVQGLSPDELRVEPALLQELLMRPHLQKGRRGKGSPSAWAQSSQASEDQLLGLAFT